MHKWSRRICTGLVLVSCLTPTVASAADIVDIAVSKGNFETLVAAVQAAGLSETLRGEGPFTVFAPTDEAFAKLPAGTVEDLLKPENKEKLIAVLTYHVVPGKVMSGDIAGRLDVATVQGSNLKVDSTSNGVSVSGARLIAPDVAADNGVIHIIDTVILPNGDVKSTISANPCDDFPALAHCNLQQRENRDGSRSGDQVQSPPEQ